ncbi:MAG TPA: two-component regulator propeller domain-containing protein [Vicinamibacterales bacterium]|jgi:PAS domain S-box-containing protein|nr:two-component regulator propeller domain-containing protein [Vicinamibacterales bacterium]
MRETVRVIARRWLRPAMLLLTLTIASNASAERLPIKAYDVASGLAHNRVKRIVQDSHGFLWFCTGGGLSRFDGYQFISYTLGEGLPAPSLNDLLETGDGEYWIATNSVGVVRLDLRAPVASEATEIRSRFSVYPMSSEPVTNRVNVLYRDSAGVLWAGTDGGLFQLNLAAGEKMFRPVMLRIPQHQDITVQVWSLAQDRAGSLWIATKFGLVRRLADGRMRHYPIDASMTDDTVAAVLVDHSGHLWVGHRTGLITFDPEAAADSAGAEVSSTLPGESRRYATRDGLDSNTVLSLRESADGHLWIRTFGAALTEFDGREFHTYAVGERVGDMIGSLAEDRAGNLWLGTVTRGALKIMRQGWTAYDQSDGLGELVASIFESASGDLYVNSSGWRVSRFDGRKFTTIRPGLPPTVTDPGWRSVSGILQDHTGEWWITTREGLYRFAKVSRFEDLASSRPKAVYRMRDGLANDDVTRLFEDSRGDIWIASWLPARDPLVRWDRATASFHAYGEKHGLRPFTSGQAFAEDATGNVWAAFREGGLARYRDGRFTLLESGEDLPVGGANGLFVDQAGRLWAVVGGGLCRIDNPTADNPHVVTYTKTHGLTSNTLLSVTGDMSGRIYVTGTRGIDRFDPSTARVTHYSASDNLAGGELTSAIRDKRGALWFSTGTGLARLAPQPEEAVSPPSILISGLRVAGAVRPLVALGQANVPRLNLAADQNNVQIDFFGIGPGGGERLRYEYRLEGANRDWSEPTEQRSINYASLAPGAYRFVVQAISPDGMRSKSPASVAFTIPPPVWRRWWFLTGAMLLTASVAGMFARSRHQRMKALRESENRFRTLAETASDAIITIDETGRIVLVNHAAETVFGYTRQELVGAELTMLMPTHVRQRHQEGFARYKQTGERNISWEAVSVPGLRKGGQEIPLEISFGVFARGNQRFFTGIARDVTERKRAEEALRRSREERLIELERVRKRIATDLHDDIGSSLTRISLLSEVARREVDDDNGSITGPLSSIAGLSRELVDSMSDIVWAINPAKDHLRDLCQRMRQFVSDVCTARQIGFRFQTPSLEEDVAVGANVRREMFLLFKEAVNNMVRHSACTQADLELRVDPHGLVLEVRDNGHGFDIDAASTGHGLRSMRERSEALGGRLGVRSSPGSGTVLTFTIPLTDHPKATSPRPAAGTGPHEYAVTEKRAGA